MTRVETYQGQAGTKWRLKKDIVIKAGTIFVDAPIRTERAPGVYVDTVIGLTKDTAGFLTYEVGTSEDRSDLRYRRQVNRWFEEVKEEK